MLDPLASRRSGNRNPRREHDEGSGAGVRDVTKASNIALPMEAVKHRQYPDGSYRPGEDGVSPDEELLREVSATWAGVYDGRVSGAPAAARS